MSFWDWLFRRKKKKPQVNNVPRGTNILMHPDAVRFNQKSLMKTPYDFKFDSNHYLILHYTAGRRAQRGRDFVDDFLDRGLCTFFIDANGTIFQQFDANKCGHHVGKSLWDGKQIKHLCAGIEVACPGEVKKVGENTYKSWFGVKYNQYDIRERDGRFWVKYNKAQEEAIAKIAAWYIAKGLPSENFLGHDDVAWPRGRKSDPGASLSQPLDFFITSNVEHLVEKYI